MKLKSKQGVALLAIALAGAALVNLDEWQTTVAVTSPVQPPGQPGVEFAKQLAKPGSRLAPSDQSVPLSLAAALDRGQPLRLKLPGREPLDFSFRDFPLLADGYRTTLGQAGRLDAELRVYEGRAIGGDGLVRPPRGYDPDHRHVEDLKRKTFFAMKRIDRKTALTPGFLDEVAETFRAATPLMTFLTKALGQAF